MEHFKNNQNRIAANMNMTYGKVEKAKKMEGEDPCWSGFEMQGFKDKDGKKVPNCVPKGSVKKSEATEDKIMSEVMAKFNDGKLKDSHGNIVTDKGRAKAIAIALVKDKTGKDEVKKAEALKVLGIIEKAEEKESANGTIKESDNKGKKAMVYMDGKWHHFGAEGYDHGYSKEAKEQFYARHAENLKGDDPRAKAFRVYAKKYW